MKEGASILAHSVDQEGRAGGGGMLHQEVIYLFAMGLLPPNEVCLEWESGWCEEVPDKVVDGVDGGHLCYSGAVLLRAPKVRPAMQHGVAGRGYGFPLLPL
jgi:hypothetical protein